MFRRMYLVQVDTKTDSDFTLETFHRVLLSLALQHRNKSPSYGASVRMVKAVSKDVSKLMVANGIEVSGDTLPARTDPNTYAEITSTDGYLATESFTLPKPMKHNW